MSGGFGTSEWRIGLRPGLDHFIEAIEWAVDDYAASPIERQFVAACVLWNLNFDIRAQLSGRAAVDVQLADRRGEIRPSIRLTGLGTNDFSGPNPGFELMPQVQVGPYRVDFTIKGVGVLAGRCFVVECDGKAFHDASGEQLDRDRKRDRFLHSQGFKVLRYSGSEIFHGSWNCVEDFLCIALELYEAAA